MTNAAANDKRFAPQILAAVPAGGLVVFDLGFFSFLWFADFTDQQKYFVTRMRHKTAYRTLAVLSQSPYYRDELVKLGQYRSHPCRHPLRMVSVLWHGQWYRYLTNVLDPQVLTARQVCELYRRRWRIEEAFLLTKRVLDLAYLWTASPNGIQLQNYTEDWLTQHAPGLYLSMLHRRGGRPTVQGLPRGAGCIRAARPATHSINTWGQDKVLFGTERIPKKPLHSVLSPFFRR